MILNIAHLYPDYLNLYGDSGNITALKNRAKWRGIEVSVKEYAIEDEIDFDNTDIIYIGGGTDKAQKLVCHRLVQMRDKIKQYADSNGCILAVCGSYQLLGTSFTLGDETFEGLKIVDIISKTDNNRFIGDIIIKCNFSDTYVVGFENHSGRTDIGSVTPLGTVLYGNGNDGKSNTEGIIYKNVIGTYIHGSLLPKNPQLCDEIIKRALTRKYEKIELTPLDDSVEIAANHYICTKYLHQ